MMLVMKATLSNVTVVMHPSLIGSSQYSLQKEAEIRDGIKNAPFYLFVCLFLCLFAQKPENLTASSSTINSFITPFSPVRLVARQARPSISILQIYDEDDAVVLLLTLLYILYCCLTSCWIENDKEQNKPHIS